MTHTKKSPAKEHKRFIKGEAQRWPSVPRRPRSLTSFQAGMCAGALAASRIEYGVAPDGTTVSAVWLDEDESPGQLGLVFKISEEELIAQALAVLGRRMRASETLSTPGVVRDYLRLLLASRENEVFVAILLDSQNRVLSCIELFQGTLTQTSVHPREIVKAVLAANAGGVIFAHNHPSGICEPSRADELLTHQLKDTLALVDVKVLDHFIIAGDEAMSFAERGLL